MLDDLTGTKDVGFLYGKDFIDDFEDYPEDRRDCFAAVDRRITMQDFLKDLGVRHQPFAVGNEAFEQYLRIALLRMRRSDQVHRHIRIDKNHAW